MLNLTSVLSRLSQEHKWSRLLDNKATSTFYSFYGLFMMSAARLTAGMLTQSYLWHLHTHTHSTVSRLGSCSPSLNASSAFQPLVLFLRRKLILPPWPLFPAGIKSLSDTCDPGNTFTRPKRGHHSNWHWNLPLQALSLTRSCAHARWLAPSCPLLFGGLCCDGGRD